MKKLAATFTAVLVCAAAYAVEPFNGVVLDMYGKPIKGVRVWTKYEGAYAVTDKEGRFGLSSAQPDDVLHLRMAKKSPVVEVPLEGRESIRVVLVPEGVREAREDDDLRNLGYGYVKNRERLTAQDGLTGAQLRMTGARDLMEALRGIVPGLEVKQTGRNGDESATMRGIHSFNANANTPLFVIDGVVVDTFKGVSLNDIDKVEVLKDAPMYGVRGANGAIVVTTLRQ